MVTVIRDDWRIVLSIVATGIVSRALLFHQFSIVTFDGTYYINQASGLLERTLTGGAFPVGYPALIAVALPIVGDGVIAAQIVSFLASVAATVALYLLALRFLRRRDAVVCALLLSVNPLFLRFSVLTMSEAAYVLFLLAGLAFFAAKKSLGAGSILGVAAITRPEAVGIYSVLALTRIRGIKPFLLGVAAFAVVYSTTVIISSKTLHRFVLLPKADAFGSSSEPWRSREFSIDYPAQLATDESADGEERREHFVLNYVERLPKEIGLIARHTLPVLFLLAFYGMYKKPGFLLASFIPFLLFPAFTARSEDRFVLPYIPVFILYGMIGLQRLRNVKLRKVCYVLIITGAVFNPFVNREQLLAKPNPKYRGAKQAGLYFRDQIAREDRIADRKPFFAFYAGGTYLELPHGPYEETIEHLMTEKVKLLSLHPYTTHYLRPALDPLLFDPLVIRGEVRFEQAYHASTGELVYERVRSSDPFLWRQITKPTGGNRAPQWSPDGQFIAYRDVDRQNRGGIYVVRTSGENPKLIAEVGGSDFPIAWSPDANSIAFSAVRDGNVDIFARNVHTGAVRRLTSDKGKDLSPSWASGTNELAFSSDRSGAREVWIKDMSTGVARQMTTGGGNTYPAISLDGRRVAWIGKGHRLNVLDRATGVQKQIEEPASVSSAPAWSPGGEFLAVEAQDWGSLDIYLVRADTGDALLLTKNLDGDGMPTWSPQGNAIAIVSRKTGEAAVHVLTGLEPYLERLTNPAEFVVMDKSATELDVENE